MNKLIDALKRNIFDGVIKDKVQNTPGKGIVYLGDNHLAWGTNMPGEEFNLSDFFNKKSNEIQYGDNRFPINWVYARTESNNVYAFKVAGDKRQLLNGETGIVSNLAEINMRTRGPLTLKIGEKFYYQAVSEQENPMYLDTTKIVEIVVRSETELPPEFLKKMTGGRESDILKRFSELREKIKSK